MLSKNLILGGSSRSEAAKQERMSRAPFFRLFAFFFGYVRLEPAGPEDFQIRRKAVLRTGSARNSTAEGGCATSFRFLGSPCPPCGNGGQHLVFLASFRTGHAVSLQI